MELVAALRSLPEARGNELTRHVFRADGDEPRELVVGDEPIGEVRVAKRDVP
jgi:hypothetical protein